MTVHLIKLCVGVESVSELAAWQQERMQFLARAGKTPELCHRTLQTPRRRSHVLQGGSLYWVIKGYVLARQRVLDLRPDLKDDGTACCGIGLDAVLVATHAHPRRPFQGWRYLDVADAPPDASGLDAELDGMPRGMREALRELRLIDC